MSAAILQGAPATTLDTDIWIDLPEWQYLRPLELAKTIGATALAPTAIALSDDSMVNFLYRVDGLGPKDLAHLPLLEETLRLSKLANKRSAR